MTFAFLFPGQGSQSLNMMDGFSAAVVKDTFDEASEALGDDLWAMLKADSSDAINQTAADKVNLGYLDAVKSDMTAGYPILPAGYGTIEAKWTELHERLRYGELTTQQFGQELFSEISLVLGR